MSTKNNSSFLGSVYAPKNYHGIHSNSFLAGSENFYVDELEVFQVIDWLHIYELSLEFQINNK